MSILWQSRTSSSGSLLMRRSRRRSGRARCGWFSRGRSGSAVSSQEAKDFKVVVALDAPPEDVRPGLSCTAKITTATRKNVLTIPIQALTVRQKGQLEPKPANGKAPPPAPKKLDPVAEKAKKEELQVVSVVANGKAVV